MCCHVVVSPVDGGVCLQDKVLPHPAHCVETGDVAGDVPGGEKAGVLGPQNQYAAEGLPVYLIAHGNHKKAHEDIWFCFECGDDLANFLQNTLRIGIFLSLSTHPPPTHAPFSVTPPPPHAPLPSLHGLCCMAFQAADN